MDRPTPRPSRLSNADVLSSSPAFATPAHPIIDRTRPHAIPPFPRTIGVLDQDDRQTSPVARTAPVLPINLPPATLRPIAFRTFTKKHNLTLTSAALQTLATFVGRHCGARWREEGLAEALLEEVAKAWKKGDGKVIVDADSDRLRSILKQLEGSMVGGRIPGAAGSAKGLSRESSATSDMLERISSGLGRPTLERDDSQDSLGVSGLDVEDDEDADEDGSKEVRGWLQVISAFDQPRLTFNPARKHFEKSKTTPSLLPSMNQRTELFRQRFHLAHQRLLRNESFQAPTTGRTTSQSWKVTSVANLLGRSGSGHLLLGVLQAAPTGQLAISDLSGSIILDLEQAVPIDDVETWICPGMLVLVDGIYEEEYAPGAGSLSGDGGIGGTISGRFVGFSIGAPRCETRAQSLGLSDGVGAVDGTIGGGFGWVDFLGVGSDRAVGPRMRRIEQKLLGREAPPSQSALLDYSHKVVVLGQAALDQPKSISALRKILESYATAAVDLASDSTRSTASMLPKCFVLFGSFISQPALSSPSTTSASQESNDASSITYKENFDILAALLHDFPVLLRHCTFVFVPGDNDAWASSFSAGAATPIPHSHVPDMFTTRVKREFASANADASARDRETRGAHESIHGQAVWTSNPARASLFGPCQEMVFFRDDASGRLRRNAVSLGKRAGAAETEQDQHSDSGISMSADVASSPPAEAGEDVMEVDGAEQPHVEPQRGSDPKLQHARRLTKTLLDQTHLSPYPLGTRPIHWSYAHALSLYPLPTALMLCDTEAECFSLVYQGCCVVNAGRLINAVGGGSARDKASWIEYDLVSRRGAVRDMML